MVVPNSLRDPTRLEEARRVQPIDPERRQVLKRLTSLAAELCDVPVALVTIVEEDRQVFAAHYGLPGDLACAGETPIEYSICQYAVSSGKPLIVESMAEDAMLCGHPAANLLGVEAYAGMPLVTGGGQTIGTLCVVDFVSRPWSDDVLARLALLADLVADQFDLQTHQRREAFRHTWRAIPEQPRW